MHESLQLRKWTLIALAFSLALVVAFLAAGRGDGEYGDERNDTLGYTEHFRCLANGGPIPQCNTVISTNATEYLYPALIAAIAKGVGPDQLYVFKFIIALAISFSIFVSCGLLSKVPSLTMMVLLADFRFWEYVANSLRNGVAMAVFLSVFAFYKLRGKRIPLLAELLAGTAHSGALVFALAPTKKLGIKTIGLLAIVCGLAVGGAPIWLPLLSQVALTSEKLAFYAFMAQDDAGGFALPVHYVLILGAIAWCYMKSNDQTFIEICNVLIVLLVFAGLLSILNLSYRSISMMLPFLAIGLSYPLAMVGNSAAGVADPGLQREVHPVPVLGFSLMYLLILTSFALALIRNFEFVQIHLA